MLDQTEHAPPFAPATRAEGLARMERFAPRMGGQYSAKRNHDFGPQAHDNVSTLSPWVRRRLVTEQEAMRTALDAHGASKAEKFIQEVFWRTYWKGWLDKRPSVWTDYTAGLSHDLDALAQDRRLSKRIAEAEEGRTGIACFDHWAAELVETGYLHNHARMWFASIWIFTLGLPWRIGADFFLRHLLDGDPASNTLGWRWVGGLHTRGKHYLAQAWNIEKFTQGRFNPKGELNEDAAPLEEDFDFGASGPVRDAARPSSTKRRVLLITEEDCTPEDVVRGLKDMAATATLRLSAERSPREVAQQVHDFDREALEDAATRARAAGAPEATALNHPRPGDVVDWARQAGADQIVTSFVPVGPVRDWLDKASPALRDAGIELAEQRRAWDEHVWPHATAGFFKVKKEIPKLIKALR